MTVEEIVIGLDQISATNRDRCDVWHADGEPWSAADWGNALAGETGELCNVIKKIRRHETFLKEVSWNTPELDECMTQLRDEIADVFLYLDLVAHHFGLRLYDCVKPKFDRVSEAQGFHHRMPEG